MAIWIETNKVMLGCAVMLLGGLLCVLGAVFNWRWLYPGRAGIRDLGSGCRRFLLLPIGLVLIACSVAFYIFRDHFL